MNTDTNVATQVGDHLCSTGSTTLKVFHNIKVDKMTSLLISASPGASKTHCPAVIPNVVQPPSA